MSPVLQTSFRRLAAGPHSTWGVGTDGRAYVYVAHTDVPIRCTEEVYQNQRWYPLVGFSSTVLPTDRSSWSSGDGEPSVQKNAILLPSEGWSWEDPWVPDTTPTLADKEGWQYAANFPGKWSAAKYKRAFVRRKRWHRIRRYTRLEQWVRLRHVVAYAFLDIAVGGTDLPGAGQKHVSVWVVGATGRLLFREGVCAAQPEGIRWKEINGPDHETDVGEELRQVSCSPSSGQLWVVTWDGRLYARTKIIRSDPIGEDWLEIPRPNGLRILNCSIGETVAWVITMDGKVWSLLLQKSESFLSEMKDTSWVEMLNSMCQISIGPNDQVVGISLEAEQMEVRCDVTMKEQVGRTWKPIVAIKKPEETAFVQSESDETEELDNSNKSKARATYTVLTDAIAHLLAPIPKISKGFSVRFAPKELAVEVYNKNQELMGRLKDDENVPTHNYDYLRKSSSSNQNLAIKAGPGNINSCDSNSDLSSTVECTSDLEDVVNSTDLPLNDFATGNQQEEDSIFKRDRWLLVSLGACKFTADCIPEDWIASSGAVQSRQKLLALAAADRKSDWRLDIYNQISSKNKCLRLAFWDFIVAATGTDALWVKTGRCQIWSTAGPLNLRGKWVDGTIEVTLDDENPQNRQQQPNNAPPSGSLKVQFAKGPQTIELRLNHITCIFPRFDSDAFQFSLQFFTPQLVALQKPLQLGIPSEEEQAMWMTELYRVICKSHWSPWATKTDGTVWAVTFDSHVTVGRPNFSNGAILNQQVWRPVSGSFSSISAGGGGLVWGLSCEGQPWVLLPDFPLGPTYSENGSDSGIQTDTVTERIFENQRYSPILGYITFPGLMSGRFHAWSDDSGLKKRTMDSVKLPGSEWEWVGDWELDFDDPCDKEGWRYAKSFSNTFYPDPKLTRSSVRRRIYWRKRRLRTVAPWQSVESPKLSRIAVQKDVLMNEKKTCPTYVWVLTENGDVLCRTGIVPESVQWGKQWQHILSPCPMVSISPGSNYTIWAIGITGKAFVRYCANAEDILTCDWREINAPSGCQGLHQISAGHLSVWTLSIKGDLYIRTGVSRALPEGTDWKYVYSDVSQISCSLDDELWVLMNYSNPSTGKLAGTMAKRTGIVTPFCPEGRDWDYGISAPFICISAGAWHNENKESLPLLGAT